MTRKTKVRKYSGVVSPEDTYHSEEPHCPLCWETDCNGEYCRQVIFDGAEDRLVTGGITFAQRRVADGFHVWENDTLLVLAQGVLSLKAFNSRVRKIYQRENPGRTFKGWAFGFENKDSGPFDSAGRIYAPNETAPMVAEALHDLAMELDEGKYEVSVSWM